MLNNKFYWGTIRRCIVAFGNMFNDITIDRLDSSDSPAKTIRVPISYAPKQRFLTRIDQLPGPAEEVSVEIVLPRLAFEMVAIDYDPTRRLSLVQQNRVVNSTATNLTTQYSPVPYDIKMNLYVYTKNIDDAHQIVEQILPYFNPDYNLSLKAIPSLNLIHDLPIILDNISFEDHYDGEFTDRRAIVWTLSFTLKVNFYGPTSRQGVIRKAIVDFYSDKELTNSFGTYSVEVSPPTAKPGEDFTFVETFEGFGD